MTAEAPFAVPASHSYYARYGLLRSVTQVAPHTYIVEGNSRYMRFAEDMVDFEGGPFLIVGGCPIVELDSPPFMSDRERITEVRCIGGAEAYELRGLSELPPPDRHDYAWVLVRTRG